jgi:hypothetical protein
VWALSLQRPDLGLGAERADAVAAAQQAGLLSGRLDDALLRSEAAAILQRALGLGQTAPAEGIAHFLDVPKRLWYFDAAHLARQYGLFKAGEGDNRFRGGDVIGVSEAWTVIGRCVAPTVLAVEDQVNGTEPMLEPSDLLEDELDEAFIDAGNTDRYSKKQRGDFVAGRYGFTVETLQITGDKKAFFLEKVLPALEGGGSATMGNAGSASYAYNHIVRIEWVTEEGLVVDDPYGRLYETSWGTLTYDKNAMTDEQRDGAKGEDNLWPWAWLGKTAAAYVQTYDRGAAQS